MVFKLGNIQIPLNGETDNFDATMMLSKSELALTNSMIQVENICLHFTIMENYEKTKLA